MEASNTYRPCEVHCITVQSMLCSPHPCLRTVTLRSSQFCSQEARQESFSVSKGNRFPKGCVCVCVSVSVCVCRLPSWLSGTSLQCRRHRIHEFNPWVGKVPWRRARQPTRVFLPGESRGLRSLVGYSPWGCEESDTTEQLSMAKSFT